MRLTAARMKALTALKMERQEKNTGLTAAQIAAMTGSKTAAVRAVLLRLRRERAVYAEGRPHNYRITTRGLVGMGSFPSKLEKRTDDGN